MLLENIKERQVKEGLSDYKFAERLGESHQIWQMTRTGKRAIGLVILKALGKAYPTDFELQKDVLIFLGFDVNLTAKIAEDATDAHQTTQKRFSGALVGRLVYRLIRWLGFKRSGAPK